MSSQIVITQRIESGKRVIEVTVAEGSDIPRDIFLWENSGTGLGEFFAVCSGADYARFQTWNGNPVPVFGNKYLKTTVGRRIMDLSTSPDAFIAATRENCTNFRLAYLGSAAEVSNTYSI